MRLRLVLIVLFTLLGLAPALAQGFVPGIDDLPLMPGLTAEAGAVVFDKPTGRIVEAGAEGPDLTAAGVRDFYRHTLAGLGWREVRARGEKLVFVREGELLTLAIAPLKSGEKGEARPLKGGGKEETAGVRVQFDVAPR